MAFPTTGLLDNFDRSDRDLTGDGGWDGPLATSATLGRLDISSQRCAGHTSSSNGNTWNTSFTDTEAWTCVVVQPQLANNIGLLLRVRQESGAADTYDGYLVRYERSTSDIVVTRATNAVHTTIATFAAAVAIGAGDYIGASMVGTTIEAFANTSGGGWTSYGTVTDVTYASGHLGLWVRGLQARLDPLGGGTPGTGGHLLPILGVGQ